MRSEKWLALLLSCVMIFSLFPAGGVVVYAESTTHTDHCVCGGSVTTGDHTHTTTPTWTGISDLSEITTAGDYYLKNDITLGNTWSCDISGVNLCLNGKIIVGADGKSVITVVEGASLAITDCQTKAGSITHAENATGRGIHNNGGTLTLWNGSITQNTTVSPSNYGGGVYNQNGTFMMNGGTISGNNSGIGVGGGVCNGYNGTATFTMNGGTISGNTASLSGGVYNWGTFNMSDGTIGGNNANDGGGVGIVGDGTFNMTGGTISGNSAGDGGGVYNTSNGTFNMSDGTISGNNASKNGGGVYNIGESVLKMSGTPNISSNVKGGTLENGVFAGGTVNNVYLPDGKTVTVESDKPLFSGTDIGITGKLGQAVVTGTTSTTGFFSDNVDYWLTTDGDGGLKITNTVTVIFNAAGGEVDPSSKTVAYNTAFGELPTPTLDNYVFEGWYTAESGGNKVESSDIASTKGDLTLYAHWSPVMYTVTVPGRAEIGKTVTITAEGVYVASNSSLNVRLTDAGGFMLTNAENATLSYRIKKGETAINLNDTILSVAGGIKDSSGSAELQFEAAEPIKFSGDYAGTVIFTILIEKETNQ